MRCSIIGAPMNSGSVLQGVAIALHKRFEEEVGTYI